MSDETTNDDNVTTSDTGNGAGESGGNVAGNVVTIEANVVAAPIADTARGMRPGGRGGLIGRFDASNAREMALRRWENYRRAASVGMTEAVAAVADLGMTKGSKRRLVAYAKTVAVQAEIAMTPDDPRSPNAWKNVYTAIGGGVGAPDRLSEGDSGGGGSGVTIHISGDVAERLALLLASAKAKQE